MTIYVNGKDSHNLFQEGVTVRSCRINRLLFANDLVLVTSSQHGLQYALDRFAAACDRAGKKTITKNTEVGIMSLQKPKPLCNISERQYKCSR